MTNLTSSTPSTEAVSIRPASKADIPLIREIADRTWRQCYATIITPEQMTYMLSRMYAPETIANEMEEGVTWEIASVDGDAIGFYSCAYDASARSLKLGKLYVLPEAQGHGCGQALLARVRALAHSLGARKVWLQVNKKNAPAIRAYQNACYNVARAAVFDIGGGFLMDDFIMELDIPESMAFSTKDAASEGT